MLRQTCQSFCTDYSPVPLMETCPCLCIYLKQRRGLEQAQCLCGQVCMQTGGARCFRAVVDGLGLGDFFRACWHVLWGQGLVFLFPLPPALAKGQQVIAWRTALASQLFIHMLVPPHQVCRLV